MSLLTDTGAIISQMRAAAARGEGGVAGDGRETERILMSAQYGPEPDQTGSYMEGPLDYASASNQKFENDDATPKRRNSKGRRQRPTQAPERTGSGSRLVGFPPITGPLFERVDVPPTATAATSVLARLVRKKNTNQNPFANYSSVCGTGQPNCVNLKLWLPFSEKKEQPMAVVVRPDATVEDVIGYILYQYTDEGRQPKVRDMIRAYSLRIVEDDGEIDNDFPALERTRPIDRFAFDQFALHEDQTVNPASEAAGPASKTENPNNKKSRAVYIRVHLYSTLEIRQTTTLHVTTDQLLSDVLKVVCDKNKLAADEYTLRHMDVKTEFSLALTVEESGINECCLVKKDRHSAGDIFVRPVGERQAELDEMRFSALLGNELGDYRKFTVTRRRPLFNAKQERTFAIDGDTIRTMPSDAASSSSDASQKVTSFDVSSIISCTLRGTDGFRIVFQRGRDNKVYDFETAEAEEIVTRVTRLVESKRRQSLS